MAADATSSDVTPPGFRDAFFSGDAVGIDVCLKRGPAHSQRMLDTALAISAHRGNAACVSVLLEYGADVASLHSDDKDANWRALLEGRESESEVDPMQPLVLACYGDHADCVELLLQHDADVHTRTPAMGDGGTPLHIAAHLNAADCVRSLLKHGADASRPLTNGNAPIHLACAANADDALVELLVHAPETRDLPGQRGLAPLSIVSRNGSLTCLDLLRSGVSVVDGRARPVSLSKAVSRGHVRYVQALLAAGTPPDSPDADGFLPPLLMAAKAGALACLLTLLDAGADPNQQDEDGRTALFHAQTGGYLREPAACTRALLDAGADPLLADAEGKMPLDAALANLAKREDSALLLLQADDAHHPGVTRTASPRTAFFSLEEYARAGFVGPELHRKWVRILLAHNCVGDERMRGLEPDDALARAVAAHTKLRTVGVTRAPSGRQQQAMWHSPTLEEIRVESTGKVLKRPAQQDQELKSLGSRVRLLCHESGVNSVWRVQNAYSASAGAEVTVWRRRAAEDGGGVEIRKALAERLSGPVPACVRA